jgi:histidinol-phosphate aminotransferase
VSLAGLGFLILPSDTNFLWVRPGNGTAHQLFEALRKRNILVRHFPGPRTGEYVRITVGTDPEADALVKTILDIGT